MKSFLASAPLLRLLLPFVAGIIFAVQLHLRLPVFPALGMALLCFLALVYFLRKPKTLLRYPGADGWMVHLALLTGGFAIAGMHTPDLGKNYLGKNEGRTIVFLARISEMPVSRENSVKLILEPVLWKDSLHWHTAGGKLLCYLQKEQEAQALQYGDLVFIRSTPEAVKGPMNPGEFDYRHYLAMHGIYHQCYAGSDAWKRAGGGAGNPVKALALSVRSRLVKIFEQQGLQGQELAVASALILGDDDHIDPGLIRAYSASGALHVLSVSGLHVAIIYIVFSLALRFLDRFRRGAILKAVLLVLLLWAYAALTGFSPSVLRSATMFSFVIAGQGLRKRTSVFNTLSASAFLLLLLDPYLVFDVGFQLSYIAVAGIVALQPVIGSLYEPGSWIMRQVWTITSVSIAAQLATFPLGLYYFHQFPTYFLFANLVVIPVSTLVIYAGVALLVTAPVPYLSAMIGALLYGAIWLLNAAVKVTEQLPGAVISTGNWSGLQILLLYLLLVFVLLFLLQKKTVFLRLALFVLLVFSGMGLALSLQRAGQEQLVIYSLPESTAVGFISGDEELLLADSSFLQQENGFQYHIQPYLQRCGVVRSSEHVLESDTVFTETFVARKSGIFSFRGKLLYIAGGERRLAEGPLPAIDLLLLTANTRLPIDTLLRLYHPKMVVADGSNAKKKIAAWQRSCREKQVAFHNLREEGALVLEY